MVRWPEVIVSYEETEKKFFSLQTHSASLVRLM